jgi:hypothetical protein
MSHNYQVRFISSIKLKLFPLTSATYQVAATLPLQHQVAATLP